MLTLIGWLTGCAGAPPNDNSDADIVDTGPADEDADGVFTPDDCDDTRADVYPGAEDAPGDAIDADCAGGDGPPFVGCTPILVPDTYPTIEDALLAGKVNLCLGPGTFTPGPLPEGAASGPTAFRGQGRGVTFVNEPSGHYEVRVLAGITATGAVSGSGSYSFNDATLVDATIDSFDNFLCDRCAFVNSPVDVKVNQRVAGVALSDCWFADAPAAIQLELKGCAGSCTGYYTDLRMYNSTFTNNDVAISMDISGDYDIYFEVVNSIFFDNGAVLTVETGSGTATASRLYADGNGNVEWSEGNDPFPDDYDFNTKSQDPELDMAYAPPRPKEGSPVIDSAGNDGTIKDFWGNERVDADKGAVER